MSHLMSLPIVLLKDGTDKAQGKSQIIRNINACQVIVDIVKTTLGPRGMDKLIYTERNVTITNDGATVMNLLNISHPAASILVDIAKSQDDEVGDGTTSVVVVAGELLNEAKVLLNDGIEPNMIIDGFRNACNVSINKLNDLSLSFVNKSEEEKKNILLKCAQTALNSKLISNHKSFFAELVVSAAYQLGDNLDKSNIGIKKVTGGSCLDTQLIYGVAFKKTFSYAGFEQQPKKFNNPKILLLNVELELKAEKENAEVRIDNPNEYNSIVQAEWDIIFQKLNLIKNSGANIVLSRLPIGDIATQFFADHDIFCAGRVEDADLKRTATATGAVIQTSLFNLNESILGNCGLFEEVQIGNERYNIFKDCLKTKAVTIILRGGAKQFIEEVERSINDAIMIVLRCIGNSEIVPGAGSIEMQLSKHLRIYSRSICNKEQIVLYAFAKALESIPRYLSHNAGYDSTDILNKLRKKHSEETNDIWYGVDCLEGDIINAYSNCIYEVTKIKRNVIYSATEAACLILSIDETIRNPSSMDKQPRNPYA
ncbi:T-complex protein 1 subunit eta, putative [Plasmodium berghei]|uniref:T-complex protein 1 subunit eta n=2 Tax=Plasmodium berghei TaxID=5821 RepID=A0A509AFF6_PLABA|nr:T-complex protein 1 subunit eta, putative [Plasmodium berghei ANKA]CXI00876.1 T-complex protein 1 subunit eta, putative [Plasmodium berghei]SCL91742.1 T-complex protein 1 subunit eta, putative [Plasmodium berghei]SCM15524.1 T-complex protein 1 subunit eta, putative [Plasmodium berghei]SCM17316.1 T-complex protein 1 subunit eta, putative [Plasmodium berghei]SCN22520.1 T-complex protein 1 subunit eta, putative [Plasmodium berghei]|eukprot:XP_034420122.1 T-complex protein 1 subunit eta, putative [Plasmodium berghei ANKA]